ncbi:DNA polymerase subunit alpha B [Anopheles sinensis]|uniref:DNA polymerase subunit alpha B n=1 Tax=Anopheles sinensis TaxID=74873 RepID=A0A084WFH5_ANOSI|nr:DNA polymerase subunit alpha B [Anopheles sinensis]
MVEGATESERHQKHLRWPDGGFSRSTLAHPKGARVCGWLIVVLESLSKVRRKPEAPKSENVNSPQKWRQSRRIQTSISSFPPLGRDASVCEEPWPEGGCFETV